MIKHACIGIPSEDLPPLGLDGVAVWPITGSTGRCAAVIAPLRRQLHWWHLRRSVPLVQRLVVCDAPRWTRKALQRRGIVVVFVNDARSAFDAITTVA
jgi:hypothetical protein